MILITSGAYSTDSLISELGELPPSFLPIGNKRLYQLQIDSLKGINGDVYLSIPDSFKLQLADEKLLKSLGVFLIRVPEGLSLGNSILYCWNATGVIYDDLRVYHGDTLINSCELANLDRISVDINDGLYERAAFEDLENYQESTIQEAGLEVLSGYFSFSKPALFFKNIIETKGNFVKSLSEYHKIVSFNKFKSTLWLDFGHLNSYFQSRTRLTTERSFNNIEIDTECVVKKSQNEEKLNAESYWFQNLPNELKLYTPQFLCSSSREGESFYKIEYLYLLPLSDIFTFGKLKGKSWERIFNSCKNLLINFKSYVCEQSTIQANTIYLEKTLNRLETFRISGQNLAERSYEIDGKKYTLNEIAKESAQEIESSRMTNVIHGDFCLSNILYDGRSGKIKLIDPRGMDFSGNYTVYGDQRYDVAKLFHSIIGLYDLIIAGQFKILHNKEYPVIQFEECENIECIQSFFKDVFFNNTAWDYKEILAINIHLFLSMVPLHSDKPDRQEGMIANAIRLFLNLKELV